MGCIWLLLGVNPLKLMGMTNLSPFISTSLFWVEWAWLQPPRFWLQTVVLAWCHIVPLLLNLMWKSDSLFLPHFTLPYISLHAHIYNLLVTLPWLALRRIAWTVYSSFPDCKRCQSRRTTGMGRPWRSKILLASESWKDSRRCCFGTIYCKRNLSCFRGNSGEV